MELDKSSRAATLGEAVAVHSLIGRPYEAELDELRRHVAEGEGGHAVTLAVAVLWAAAARGDYRLAVDEAATIAETSRGNAPNSLAIAARLAVLDRDPARARDMLDRHAQLGVRGPTIDAQMQVAQAGLDALEGRWTDAARAFQAVTRWLAEQRLHFDEAIAWMCVLATAPDGDASASAAERDARTLLEAIPSAPFLAQVDRLAEERAARSAAAARSATSARASADVQ